MSEKNIKILKTNKAAKSKEVSSDMANKINKIDVLVEALPYIKKFTGETFVVKYGGSAMGDEQGVKKFIKDVVLLKSCGINVVVVHGGGPQITTMLERLKIKSEFIDGMRVTTAEAVEIIEMVLCSINKKLVSEINAAGGMAIGLCGKDANLMMAGKMRKTYKETDSNIEKILDLGLVGAPTKINTDIFAAFDDTPIIPVIAPIGFDEYQNTYNINADLVAGAIASALEASKLILLSDVDGIMIDRHTLLSNLSIAEAKRYINTGLITGGMIPKVETCIDALERGVGSVHIINGSTSHALLLEILTDTGIGSMITMDRVTYDFV